MDSLENTAATKRLGTIDLTDVGVTSVVLQPSAIQPAAYGAGNGTADIPLTSRNNLDVSDFLATPLRSRYQGNERLDTGQRKEIVEKRTSFFPWAEKSLPGKGWGEETNPQESGFESNDDQIFSKKVPTWYGRVNSLLTGVGSPTDLKSQALPVLDATGNMIWLGPNFYGVYDSSDDPYEINLLKPTTYDSPFGLSELTALNRVDPIEDSRLGNFPGLENFFAFGAVFNQFTTHSYEIPTLPSINVGRGRASSVQGLKRSLREMFAGKIQQVLSLIHI